MSKCTKLKGYMLLIKNGRIAAMLTFRHKIHKMSAESDWLDKTIRCPLMLGCLKDY